MRGNKFLISVICFIAVMVTASFASAEEPKGRHFRIFAANQFSIRSNPTGFGNSTDFNMRYYYSNSDSILWKNNHIGFGPHVHISPATGGGGVFLEIEPIAAFNLRLEYNYVRYFGWATALISFPDKDSDYSDSVLERFQIPNDDAVSANGHSFKIKPTFQMQVSRFVLLNMTSLEWWKIDDIEGYFYEPTNDTLMKVDDYFFSNQTLAGVEVWKRSDVRRVIAGTRYSFFRVDSTKRERHQLDAVMVWMMGEKLWLLRTWETNFTNPLIMLAAGGYLEDRYREKELFAGLIFQCDYDLWRSK